MSDFYGPHSRMFLDELLASKTITDVQIQGCDVGTKAMAGSTWSNAHIVETMLDECNVSNSVWDGVTLAGCGLKGSIFNGAAIRNSSFDHCNCTKINFTYTRISNSRLSECLCPRLDLRHSVLDGCHLRNLDLTGAKFDSALFNRCQLEFPGDRGITGLRMGSACKALFIDCQISGEFLVDCEISDAVFVRCRFDAVDWNNINHEGAFFLRSTSAPLGRRNAMPLSQSAIVTNDFLNTLKERIA